MNGTRHALVPVVVFPYRRGDPSYGYASGWQADAKSYEASQPHADAVVSAGRQSLPAAHVGVFGLDGVEWDERGVGDALGERDPVARALVERDADHHPVADHEGRKRALLHVGEGGRDPRALLSERLAARELRSRGALR